MLFATSCETDADVTLKAGKTSVVTFSVGTPEIVSRAYSDGLTATVLQYAVYDEDGELLPALTVTDGEIHGSTTVNLKLTTGKEYSVIFWAAAPNAPYTVDFDKKTMKVDYTGALSNDENRDAFYKYHTFKVAGTQTEVIELKRPFAQLNVGTNDYVDAAKAGYVPTKSAVTVSNIYNTLNFADGTVSGNEAITFDYNTIPVGETFPVQGYEYLSMNYLLVAAQKSLVEIKFGYTETDANDAMTRTVGSVPVQRNYRTNIFGQLFTSDVAINVEIVPEYEVPDYDVEIENPVAVKTFADFTAALAAGATDIVLAEDITNASRYELKKNVNIDLNGKSMTLPMIDIHSTATVKNGTINGKVYARTNADIVFENVKFSGDVSDNLSTEGHLAIKPGCKLYVKDCLFSPTSVSGSQTKPLSFEGGSSIMKFENCEFKSTPYKKQVYFNSLSATGSLDFTNCNFNNKTPNIMFAATCPLTNVTMSGTTKLSSVTFEINRAKDAVTADDLAYLQQLIANNSFSSVKVYYAGGSNEYIR